MLLQAPAEPIRTRPIHVDDATTPRRLTLRVMAAAPRYSVPAAVLSITHQVGEALVPVLMGLAIERAVSSGDLGQLLLWLGLLAADFALLSFSWRFGSRLGELGMLAVQHRLRTLVTEHLLLRASGARRASNQPGVALSLATSDVNRLSAAVEIGVYPVGQLAAVLFGGSVLLAISWPLGIAVLIGAPLLLWLTERAGRTLRTRSGDEQAAAAVAAGQAADLMAGYRVIRGIGAEAEASSRYRQTSQSALASTLLARRAEGAFGGTMDVASGLFLTGVAVAAGLSAITGGLGVGELIAVVGLAQFLIDPLQYAARNAGGLWASAMASSTRLLALLREVGPDATSVTRSRRSAARGIGLVAEGEVVGVAADGAEAEAVIAALEEAHPDALAAPHEAHLFTGTVWQNVALPTVDAARARAALTAAGCDELIELLPQGWDSPVGENGSTLSGGQRQRVALARALAQDAPVLVLNDPTTAVDAVTEAAIADRLRQARAGRRTVVVTHSPALLAIADRVVRIDRTEPRTEAAS
ncbi:ABC transporter transmembrane domain-containing protein [Agreia bicolorata]|uniref:ABC transporter transmembrane domain-containing protein n=1 Tax=Agreia bicolorata TaxID=110935 RepID=UPI000695CF43|nr:ABC transporter ATP-binding protein [Agreia bicolorata]